MNTQIVLIIARGHHEYQHLVFMCCFSQHSGTEPSQFCVSIHFRRHIAAVMRVGFFSLYFFFQSVSNGRRSVCVRFGYSKECENEQWRNNVLFSVVAAVRLSADRFSIFGVALHIIIFINVFVLFIVRIGRFVFVCVIRCCYGHPNIESGLNMLCPAITCDLYAPRSRVPIDWFRLNCLFS